MHLRKVRINLYYIFNVGGGKMNDIAIRVEDVHIRFNMSKEKVNGIKETIEWYLQNKEWLKKIVHRDSIKVKGSGCEA